MHEQLQYMFKLLSRFSKQLGYKIPDKMFKKPQPRNDMLCEKESEWKNLPNCET